MSWGRSCQRDGKQYARTDLASLINSLPVMRSVLQVG